jgi:predicted dinucleotide-binding enzyme
LSPEHKETFILRRIVLALTLLAAAPAAAQTETIAVIGTGNVGSTLGQRWAALGHTIIYGSRDPRSEKVQALVKSSPKASATTPREAAAKAGMVLLAIPSGAAEETVTGLGDLKGKIIIDAMNTLTIKDGAVVEPANQESLLAQIQRWAPGALVVKAFNTTNTSVMKDPRITGGPVTMPITGPDAAAKARVARLATSLGFEVVDLGGMEAALFADQLGRLYVGYGVKHRPQRMEFHLRTWVPK